MVDVEASARNGFRPSIADSGLLNSLSSYSALQRMVMRIDRAVKYGDPRLDGTLAAILAESMHDPNLLDGCDLTPSCDRYARHLVYQGEGYSLLAIVWLPCQMSPVHSHRTWCALSVYRGWINETLFRRAPVGAEKVAERRLFRGDVSNSPPDPESGHRMANLGTEAAVSLHVYGATYERLGQDVNHIWTT
jgi:predicted metal-dependent enzyme (double-stranded beta helix superfamily)